MGGRLFDIWSGSENEEMQIYRLPGWGKIKRNDVLVFNFPYPCAWDSIGIDLGKYYVKRCVALPGDTFEIQRAHFKVRGCKDVLGNRNAQIDLERQMECGLLQGIEMVAYPGNSAVGWTICDFGPFYIPRKGSVISLNEKNVLLYKNAIEWEQRKKLRSRNGQVLLGDSTIADYRFTENYYFVCGDRVANSKDSRYWGLLPEKYIVGRASLIWKSVNAETGEVRWNRVLKKIR